MRELSLLSALDADMLAAFCEAHARFRLASEKIADMAKNDPTSDGLLARMPSGAVVQNPLIGVANKAMRDMVRIGAELGLSPSARAGIEQREAEQEDEISKKFFSR
jgi:P27 family predicted phage terminase small subunit